MDITCLLSALLFFLGNLLKLIYLGKEQVRDFSWSKFTALETESIQKEWDFRIANKPHLMATGIITSLAWFVFCFPMLQLVFVLNQQKSAGTISRSLWLHSGIIILTLGGCFMEWIANFLYMGSTLACEVMIKNFNLQSWTDESDMIGYKSLEVAYFAIRGMKFWVDAFEWIALSFTMIFVFVSVNRYRVANRDSPFGMLWNALGLCIGLLSLLDFITEVLRTVDFRVFSQIAFYYGTANRLVLLPAWLIILGWRLPYALMKIEKEANDSNAHQPQQHELQLTTINENPLSIEDL